METVKRSVVGMRDEGGMDGQAQRILRAVKLLCMIL